MQENSFMQTPDRTALLARVQLTETKPKNYQGSMSADFNTLGIFFVLLDGQAVGDFCVERTPQAWHAHAHLLEAYRGIGLASLVYDLIDAEARSFGSHLAPSPTQTDEAKLFWTRRSTQTLNKEPAPSLFSLGSAAPPPLLVFDLSTFREAEINTGAAGPLLNIGERLRSRTDAAAQRAALLASSETAALPPRVSL